MSEYRRCKVVADLRSCRMKASFAEMPDWEIAGRRKVEDAGKDWDDGRLESVSGD